MILHRNRKDAALCRRLELVLKDWSGGSTGRTRIEILRSVAAGRSDAVVAKYARMTPRYVRRIYSDYRRQGEDAFIDLARRSSGGRAFKLRIEDVEAAYRVLVQEASPSRVSLVTKMATKLGVSPKTILRMVKAPEFGLVLSRVRAELLPPP